MRDRFLSRAGGIPRRRGFLPVLVASGLWLLAGTPAAADEAQRGKQLFNETSQPPCSVCHTMAAAGAAGEIGPNLDELKPSVDRIARAVRQGVGVMPGYRETLKEDQIETLIRYVAQSIGVSTQ